MSYQAAPWSPRSALPPCLAISSAFAYSLHVLSAPRHYRLGKLALVFALTAGFHKSFDDLCPDDRLNAVFAHGTLVWLVHMVHVTLVRGDAGYIAGDSTRPELPEGGWTSAGASGLGTCHRAYKMLYNFRGIGTSWQVVKTPRQDEAAGKQSRTRFLLRRLLTIFCRYLSLAAYYEVSDSGVLGRPTGGPLTAREIAGRAHLVLDFLVHSWLWLASWHEVLSVVFVCVLGLDEPHEWPPLYGDLREAYTIRRFWAHFWHRIVYAPFRAVADAASARVFGRGRRHRGAARRLVNVALVFLLSGLLHSLTDRRSGLCNYWGSGIFYFAQPAGFVLEALARRAWAPLRRMAFAPGSRVPGLFERTVGYMSVLAWFSLLCTRRWSAEVNCREKARV